MGEWDLKSMKIEELEEYLERLGEKRFRAGQLYGWFHQKQIRDFREMGNVPNALKEKLLAEQTWISLKEAERYVSGLDGTEKYLFELGDGHVIESVLMRYRHGNSVCISSQVGCRMGCRFCASTIGGLARNLTPSEMLDQVYMIQRQTGERVSNVVVMGTGEPFDNYDNVIRFLELLTDGQGIHISQRNVTVSTCGLVPEIRRFADRQTAVGLAISLHAPTDEKRRTLMPVANRYSIAEILSACRYYIGKTNRRVTFEYSLVAGVNDGEEDAAALARLLKGMLCHVNLIPVNPVRERSYRRSGEARVRNFKNMLEKSSINVTIRRAMGRDIQAACGQLRKDYADKKKQENDYADLRQD